MNHQDRNNLNPQRGEAPPLRMLNGGSKSPASPSTAGWRSDADVRYLSPKKVADRLDMSVEVVRRWCRNGVVPGARKLRGGRQWRIPEWALSALLERLDSEPMEEPEDKIIIATNIIDAAIRRDGRRR